MSEISLRNINNLQFLSIKTIRIEKIKHQKSEYKPKEKGKNDHYKTINQIETAKKTKKIDLFKKTKFVI